jgi:hypothetical protein
MHAHNLFRALLLALLISTLALIGAGCGGPRNALNASFQPSTGGTDQDGSTLFPNLPGLPTGADDPVQGRTVSLVDNFETGNQAIKSSPNGVFVNGSGLDMGPAGNNKNGWAIWRWGAFQNGNQPRQLKTDITLTGQNQYWVLLSDYSKNKWQVFGPNKVGAATINFSPGDNYLSPSANTYVALLVVNTYKMTVNTLNLVCDNDATPPAAPTALNVPQNTISPHGAQAKWTKPGDADLNHYELYSGPADNFSLTDAGVTLISDTLPNTLQQYTMTGLTAQTTYHIRIRAFDTAGNASPLSNTATFTTKPNGPPVPDFTYNPTDVQKNVAITFDPSATTDPDDPLTGLTVKWDWENDGTDDDTYVDATHTIQHSFPNKGTVTVKLTVSDGTAGASTTQTFIVGQQIETRVIDFSTSGDPVSVLLSSADYASGAMGALVQTGTGNKIRFYNGTAWQDVDFSQFATYQIDDLVVSAGTLYLVVSQRSNGGSGNDLNWSIYSSTGGIWTSFKTGTITAHPLDYGAKLAFSSSGKMSLAIAASIIPDFQKNPNTALYILHQKSDNSLLTYTAYQHDSSNDDLVYNIPTPRVALQRSDSTTYCAYTQNYQVAGNPKPRRFEVHTATVTDAGGNQTMLYDAVGGTDRLPMDAVSSKDPADESKMYWSILGDDGTVYFGDSFGTANDTTERFKPTPKATDLLGAALGSDNQCLVYYNATETNAISHIYGYKSQGAITYDPLPGVGSAGAGNGNWFTSGGNTGVYIIANEPRDGEVTGRLIENDTIHRTDTVELPLQGLPTGDHSIAFITKTNGFEVLNHQNVPTAFRHSATVTGGPFISSELGLDTWADPKAGASGTTDGEIILGSIYDPSVLVINRFNAGNPVGDYLASYTDTTVVSMAYNPTQNLTGIAYSQNGTKNVVFRTWNGTTLSSAATVYSGATTILDMVLKARPDGQWGIAWDDTASNVRMAETTGGTWQPVNTLSTTTLNFAVGSLGMEYASNGDAGIAVERAAGTSGLYFGLKASGSSTATWTLVQASTGFDLKSMNVHFMFGNVPTIIFYNNNAGIQMAQTNGGPWTVANLAFYISGSPLVSVIDSIGTLAVAGKDNATGKAAVCFLSQ